MAGLAGEQDYSYVVPRWLWARDKHTVLRNARHRAKARRMDTSGEPQVHLIGGHVVLVWPQETLAAAG